MKSTKNMITYYNIKHNFNKQFQELEVKMLKGVPGYKEKYTKLLKEYKKFTSDYLYN